MRISKRHVMMQAACLGLMICACGVAQERCRRFKSNGSASARMRCSQRAHQSVACASSGVGCAGSELSGRCPC
jgi:hypothetical protein